MKFKEIKNLNSQELFKKLNQLRRQLFESRMKLKVQRLTNPLSIRFLRRDMARIQTAISSQKKMKQGVKDEN